MRRAGLWAVAMGMVVAGGFAAWAQTAPQNPRPASSAGVAVTGTAPQSPSGQVPMGQAVTGGKLHGQVKSGNVPLPGVTVTAQNTLTGKRYSTTTDITGAWSLTIPQNGRYVIRTQFAAFAVGSQEAVLNATSHDQTVAFVLILASRAAQQEQRQEQGVQGEQAIRQLAGNGAQTLSLMSALAADTENQGGTPSSAGANGAALPSIAGNSDFSGDSVAISGQSGQVSPLAGLDMDRIRDAIETIRAQDGLPGGQIGGIFAGALGGGGFGGDGFGGGGFGGGGRGNFRGFNPGQPHGAIFWIGSNSALNAEPFALRGQSQEQPPSGTNRFGITFMSAPYIPKLTKPSGKDMVFLTLPGQRSSNPLDEYATVPTDAERTGDFSAAGLPTIYDPTTGLPFPNNIIPNGTNGTVDRIVGPAKALLTCTSPGCQPYFPAPNLPGYAQNYHLLTTAQSNTTQAGVRYMRSLGANATQPGGSRGGFGGGGGGGRRNQNQGLRQSINFNYNWTNSASDNVNNFPQLGGKSSSDSNSVQAGYTVGYHKLTNVLNASWNRSTSQTTNFFTNGTDIANQIGIQGTDSAPLNYRSEEHTSELQSLRHL